MYAALLREKDSPSSLENRPIYELLQIVLSGEVRTYFGENLREGSFNRCNWPYPHEDPTDVITFM